MRKNFKIFHLLLISLCGLISLGAAYPEKWHIWINIPEYKLRLYKGSELYRTYNVAVGKAGTPSPVGDFWIINKVVNPTWSPEGRKPVPPGPRNPLGKYWLGLNVKGYGIHGNNAPWSIGTPVSKGCFRLANQDVAELFKLVPVKTEVKITYITVFGGIDAQERAWLMLYPDIYRRQNRERIVKTVLEGLGWKYLPHQAALKEILEKTKSGKLEVPRKINVGGDLEQIDAFFWNNQIYLPEKSMGALVSLPAVTLKKDFSEYLDLPTLTGLGAGKLKLSWDQDLNLLNIQRLKIMYNGKLLEQAGKWLDDRLYLDPSLIAQARNTKLEWDGAAAVATAGEIKVEGKIVEGVLMTPVDSLLNLWPDLKYHWDEESWTLRVEDEKGGEGLADYGR